MTTHHSPGDEVVDPPVEAGCLAGRLVGAARPARATFLACLAATWLTGSAAAARPTSNMTHESCVFDDFRPLAAVPYYMTVDEGGGEVTRLVGASLYVVPVRQANAESLALQLDRDLSAPVHRTADTSCRPNVAGVRAVVVASLAGFWIVFVASEERGAAALVKWSERVVAAHGQKARRKSDGPKRRSRRARPQRSTR